MNKILLLFILMVNHLFSGGQLAIRMEAPSSCPQYGTAEFAFRIKDPPYRNPFTEVEVTGTFTSGKSVKTVNGFADSQDGSVFRLRFSPDLRNAAYHYIMHFKGTGLEQEFSGNLRSTAPVDKGPVIADPEYPKHFIYAGTREPFIHLGCTEYHLVDITNNDAQVEATIDYCRQNGFNKIRFLLAGYPRDFDNRSSDDVEHGVPPDPWKSLNYGSLPGKVNPLPAWEGKPHNYDFTRFNTEYWQRIDKAVLNMKSKGIVATCILTIEKQNLPKEYGTLTENEFRFYNYAVARLAAFNNVWWDLGNEHNEYRDSVWGNKMGDFVKKVDPYDRLSSAHAYADFFYNQSGWADFIITQQYGTPDTVHKWALAFYDVPKPYVNEEYGYEGMTDKPLGHGMNADWVRKCHWAIAMAGGYGTYGDWSNGASYFYMGIPGPGKAVAELNHLKKFFESVPFRRMIPSDRLTSNGYCLSLPGRIWVFYFPEDGSSEIDLSSAENFRISGKWFNPSTGNLSDPFTLKKGKNTVMPPSDSDWMLLINSGKSGKK